MVHFKAQVYTILVHGPFGVTSWNLSSSYPAVSSRNRSVDRPRHSIKAAGLELRIVLGEFATVLTGHLADIYHPL